MWWRSDAHLLSGYNIFFIHKCESWYIPGGPHWDRTSWVSLICLLKGIRVLDLVRRAELHMRGVPVFFYCIWNPTLTKDSKGELKWKLENLSDKVFSFFCGSRRTIFFIVSQATQVMLKPYLLPFFFYTLFSILFSCPFPSWLPPSLSSLINLFLNLSTSIFTTVNLYSRLSQLKQSASAWIFCVFLIKHFIFIFHHLSLFFWKGFSFSI